MPRPDRTRAAAPASLPVRPVRPGLVAVLGAATAVLALTVTPARATPGDSLTLCASQYTPSGYVDVSWGTSSSCGSGSAPNRKQVTEVAGYGAGTTVDFCHSSIPPAGWVETAIFYSSSCQYNVNPGFTRNAGRMLQLAGYPIGTYVSACANTLPPSGWTPRSEYYDSNCQSGPNPSTGKNAWQLQRIS
ncbi:hypothetical protein ACIRBX_01480 [Kitasatospora sp. NPDC096147]|uniref:hypothetical protein n=1 Tax=Kitasatospora sp. NPDC096147 TaxID=3364093 RepID=UPI0037F88AC3